MGKKKHALPTRDEHISIYNWYIYSYITNIYKQKIYSPNSLKLKIGLKSKLKLQFTI